MSAIDLTELRIPPYPAGIVQLLRERGHEVLVRKNRNNSLRYRIDGGRELMAIEMDRFFLPGAMPGKCERPQ